MPTIAAKDGTQLYYTDWGQGRPIILIHGWPLRGDSWDHQALALANNGHRVITYDRRGFGRSDKPWSGYDYHTFTDDLEAVVDGLGLDTVDLAGFSMGGGESVRYAARHGAARVRRIALVSSVAGYLLKTDDNPDGVDGQVFEDMKAGIRKDRPGFWTGFFKDFYGQGLVSGVSQGVLDYSSHVAFDASHKGTLDSIDAFGRTDFRPDCRAVTVPTLILHGTADKTVPIDCSGRLAHKLIAGSQLKEYNGAAHGILATHAEQVEEDLKAFFA